MDLNKKSNFYSSTPNRFLTNKIDLSDLCLLNYMLFLKVHWTLFFTKIKTPIFEHQSIALIINKKSNFYSSTPNRFLINKIDLSDLCLLNYMLFLKVHWTLFFTKIKTPISLLTQYYIWTWTKNRTSTVQLQIDFWPIKSIFPTYVC